MLEKMTSDENRYLKRFEMEFRSIIDEIGALQTALPQYKTAVESLRERLDNIRGWVEVASKIRYMQDADPDAVLANLIAQILIETDDLDKLKPVVKEPDLETTSNDLFKLLGKSNSIDLDDAMSGFDFYDNNPYKKSAEKKIAKIKRKQK